MEQLINNLLEHEQLRANAINMIASENRTSPLVRVMMASDLAHRYSAELYGGTGSIRRIMDLCKKLIQELFQAVYVLITPLSGNLAVLAAMLGLTKPEDRVAKVFGEDGGYPLNLRAFNRVGLKLPFNHTTRTIDVDLSRNPLLQTPPSIIMLGQSVFTHPHPVQAFNKMMEEHSLKIPIVFDGSHVLGLIAGKQFQDPLGEGADILLGSTHKSFFGPQGGLLVSNNQKIFKKVERFGGFTQGSHILVDNMHPNRIGALAIASLELLEFGKDYAAQIVKNSQALAKQFHYKGLPVKGDKVGFTQSHQVLLDYPQQTAFKIKNKLESIGIMTDALLRFGTSEVTRLGMKEPEMKVIADIITDCIQENRQVEKLIKQIKNLNQTFQTVQFTFDIREYASVRNLIKSYFPY
ncbi:MAG: hypothetical protein HWN66_18790 [Candidatus Helarchaeota archaeon]|nr:hypothetical protein [Candidatus Helarchaeota archaeon]